MPEREKAGNIALAPKLRMPRENFGNTSFLSLDLEPYCPASSEESIPAPPLDSPPSTGNISSAPPVEAVPPAPPVEPVPPAPPVEAVRPASRANGSALNLILEAAGVAAPEASPSPGQPTDFALHSAEVNQNLFPAR